MKYCSNCGNKLNSKDKFCASCGKENIKEDNKNTISIDRPYIENKNIAVMLILTIITCGIYSLVWIYQITEDVNRLNEDNNMSGGLTILLAIITCGIYLIYWGYDMGRKLYNSGQKYNINISDNSILYLLLPIFKLNIINLVLIQSDLNKFER